jgi:nucleoside-diphosphate-sugar epimerase
VKSVAIIGASSHVAKNLIVQNQAGRHWAIDCYARNRSGIDGLLAGGSLAVYAGAPVDFGAVDKPYDAVINCVGFGTPDKVRQAGLGLFTVTEEIDNLILAYQRKYPLVRHLNFSSGAVYGTSAATPVGQGFRAEIGLSPLVPAEFYRLSKLHQEAKHRALPESAIVDIRLFSFFSRFIEPGGGFLMTDIMASLAGGQAFRTGPNEIYRDFISPGDLYALLDSILRAPAVNAAFDTYSAAPIAKTDLLDHLTREFGLKVEVTAPSGASPTGVKPYYYSLDRSAHELFGYEPQHTSWEGIAQELAALGFERKSA